MKRGLKTFARALRDGNLGKAKEMSDRIVQGDLDAKVWEGYHMALEGMISGLEAGNDLALIRQIADGKYSKKELEDLKKKMEQKSAQKFIPPDERGFNDAWADVLQVMIE
ncbi:hypothetical protein AKJ45_00535 [candidate division MSBL1 archaeon SCGC-AAA261F19]|uniref:Uncharacterized protein n=3 Tax=candidate division MSBL1 TaxID=215777 RepID=A0A133UY80_9EURY|nr:hypothetical protein AKJ42_03695 [candidate division MSBL1 archaeon SCGC-AAA261C02]KXB02818.1 hypothetical protein AKJ43_00530 [candidate division MSBL1 archaeon SCGC-AAA261D19]KXB03806.1 hypothetical protein AKJ45_00535 [candidate division MSBL1 archaeon SCGC-AAA261F19]